MITGSKWMRGARPAGLLLAAVCVVAMIDYASRAGRVIDQHDPAELQVLATVGGVPHGTSYPLYMWLLRAIALLPIGPLAFRYNVFSVLCGGATLALLGWFTSRLDRAGRSTAWFAGVLAAGAMALSVGFTGVSIFTGMYTLHLALAFLGMTLLLRWSEEGRGADLIWALGVFGTMLANHIMTLALAPGVLVVMAWTLYERRSHWRYLVRGLVLATVAFLVLDVFLFWLLWRNRVPYDHWWGIILGAPEFFEIPPGAKDSFWYAWWYEATCRQFRYDAMGASLGHRWRVLGGVLPLLLAELSPVLTVLSFVGMVRLVRERSFRVLTLIVVVIASHIYFGTGFTAPDKFQIYMLPVVALAAALGAYAACWPLERAKLQWLVPQAIVLGMLWFTARELTRNLYAEHMAHRREWWLAPARRALGPRPDDHDEHKTIDRMRIVIEHLPPKAVVFASWEEMYNLHYVARIERKTHDLAIYQPLMYGRGSVEFTMDYAKLVADPTRTVPVFLVGNWNLPEIPGHRRVQRAPDIYEWIAE